MILDLLGRPFANGIADGTPNSGIAGESARAVCSRSSRCWSSSDRALRARLSSLLLVAWSLLVALQIALFRTERRALVRLADGVLLGGLLMLLAAAPAPVRD